MVKPYQRSHSMARKKRVTPGNRNTIIYRRRHPKRAHCGMCGAILGGVPSVRNAKMNKYSKVERRPERQYGGRLCPSCLKKLLLEETSKL